ncbi:MAG: aldose 1-epimerase family protein [Planctomycetaceae bacterium]|jgi:galactose mutarotase-like enzyme
MTVKRIPLIDVAAGIYETNAIIDSVTTGVDIASHSWKVNLKRLAGGRSDGIDLIELNNGHLCLSILPTRGMGIWKAECGTLPLKWDSPVSLPVHPSLVDQSRRSGIGWLDGFNELVCRCGLGWHGAPGNDRICDDSGAVISEQFLPLHGRIANLPAHQVFLEVEDSGLISLTGIVDETSMFGERLRLTSVLATQAGSPEFSIHDTVTNLGGSAAEVEVLYHCNFGTPLLGAGSTLHTAATRVTPRDTRAAEGIGQWETFLGPTPGYAEQVYFATPINDAAGQGLAVLRSPDGQVGLALRFDTSTLPWLTLWKNTQAAEDGYCCGLEPSSSLPNHRGFEREQGRVVTLRPGESREFALRFEIAESQEQTRNLIEEVCQLQGQAPRLTESAPATDLSPS